MRASVPPASPRNGRKLVDYCLMVPAKRGSLDSLHILAVVSIASLMTVSCSGPEPPSGRGFRADFAEVLWKRIFFGHQSVGMNLLSGVRRLAGQEGAALRVVETIDPSALVPATLAHAFLAENGDPERKLASFERALDGGIGDVADVALMKFCYVDFGPDTDTAGLFAKYQDMVTRQRTRHPRLGLVHVTVPLTTVQSGWRALAKRALGHLPAGVAENAKREQYNEFVRRAYAGREPLFDLARLESTAPDGTGVSTSDGEREVPTLFAAYTDDGGHLNEDAQLRLARELILVLASAR